MAGDVLKYFTGKLKYKLGARHGLTCMGFHIPYNHPGVHVRDVSMRQLEWMLAHGCEIVDQEKPIPTKEASKAAAAKPAPPTPEAPEVKRPAASIKDAAVETKAEPVVETTTTDKSINYDDMGEEELRRAARKAGLSHHWNKSLDTLRKELSGN